MECGFVQKTTWKVPIVIAIFFLAFLIFGACIINSNSYHDNNDNEHHPRIQRSLKEDGDGDKNVQYGIAPSLSLEITRIRALSGSQAYPVSSGQKVEDHKLAVSSGIVSDGTYNTKYPHWVYDVIQSDRKQEDTLEKKDEWNNHKLDDHYQQKDNNVYWEPIGSEHYDGLNRWKTHYNNLGSANRNQRSNQYYEPFPAGSVEAYKRHMAPEGKEQDYLFDDVELDLPGDEENDYSSYLYSDDDHDEGEVIHEIQMIPPERPQEVAVRSRPGRRRIRPGIRQKGLQGGTAQRSRIQNPDRQGFFQRRQQLMARLKKVRELRKKLAEKRLQQSSLQNVPMTKYQAPFQAENTGYRQPTFTPPPPTAPPLPAYLGSVQGYAGYPNPVQPPSVYGQVPTVHQQYKPVPVQPLPYNPYTPQASLYSVVAPASPGAIQIYPPAPPPAPVGPVAPEYLAPPPYSLQDTASLYSQLVDPAVLQAAMEQAQLIVNAVQQGREAPYDGKPASQYDTSSTTYGSVPATSTLYNGKGSYSMQHAAGFSPASSYDTKSSSYSPSSSYGTRTTGFSATDLSGYSPAPKPLQGISYNPSTDLNLPSESRRFSEGPSRRAPNRGSYSPDRFRLTTHRNPSPPYEIEYRTEHFNQEESSSETLAMNQVRGDYDFSSSSNQDQLSDVDIDDYGFDYDVYGSIGDSFSGTGEDIDRSTRGTGGPPMHKGKVIQAPAGNTRAEGQVKESDAENGWTTIYGDSALQKHLGEKRKNDADTISKETI